MRQFAGILGATPRTRLGTIDDENPHKDAMRAKAVELGLDPVDATLGELVDAMTPHGAQSAPVPNDGPSMHDLVIKDIMSRPVSWDLSYGRAAYLRQAVADDLLDRKQFGWSKYGVLLQARNGRDALRDLYDELMDAAVYARQRMAEGDEDTLEWAMLAEVYDDVVTSLVKVKRMRVAAASE